MEEEPPATPVRPVPSARPAPLSGRRGCGRCCCWVCAGRTVVGGSSSSSSKNDKRVLLAGACEAHQYDSTTPRSACCKFSVTSRSREDPAGKGRCGGERGVGGLLQDPPRSSRSPR